MAVHQRFAGAGDGGVRRTPSRLDSYSRRGHFSGSVEMTTGTAVSVEEYLRTSYEPNCEYIDGVLIQKPMPTTGHSRLQLRLGALIDLRFPNFWVGSEL